MLVGPSTIRKPSLSFEKVEYYHTEPDEWLSKPEFRILTIERWRGTEWLFFYERTSNYFSSRVGYLGDKSQIKNKTVTVVGETRRIEFLLSISMKFH